MRETWYYIISEFKALGLRCVAIGPEFWLVVAAIAGAVMLGMVVSIIVFKGGKR